MDENAISKQIVEAALEVRKTLGPGLLESIDEGAFCYELSQRNLRFERQKHVPVHYKGNLLETPLCLDLLVENLVINFGARLLKHNIHRVVNGL